MLLKQIFSIEKTILLIQFLGTYPASQPAEAHFTDNVPILADKDPAVLPDLKAYRTPGQGLPGRDVHGGSSR